MNIKCLLLALFFLPAHTTFAQQDSLNQYDMINVDKPPVYPGGEPEMLRFIHRNLNFNGLLAFDQTIHSRAVLRFTVTESGTLEDFVVLKDPCKGCGDEIIRVLKTMPSWTPGETNGKKVRVRYVLPLLIEWD